jgi:glycosyltransferase involved in cell wall biosynthesis
MKKLKIHFSNVNFNSSSGPNSFATRLANELVSREHLLVEQKASHTADAFLAFIEPSSKPPENVKFLQRLDGIWFKPEQFETHNKLIKWSYENCDHVIWQSEFDKNMTTKHWGSRKGSVIRNGISLKKHVVTQPNLIELRAKYEKVFVCASSWHRQKRLKENIDLFLAVKNKYKSACLIVMGSNPDYSSSDPDIFYTGNVPHNICLEVYSMADWMIHLAWLDHCPNVVVEALSQNTPVICTNAGGTHELVNNSGIIIPEVTQYNFELCDYDDPPALDITDIQLPAVNVENRKDLDIKVVASQYEHILGKDDE